MGKVIHFNITVIQIAILPNQKVEKAQTVNNILIQLNNPEHHYVTLSGRKAV